MRRPRPGFTVRRMLAATVAVVALAFIALGIQSLSVAVASHRQRAALLAAEAAREQAARDRAIIIAAREYERMHGNPPPSAATVAPGQIAHVIARREADGHDYLVRFGYQNVVNDKRDSSGRPIPFQSGLTVLESFRVKEDGTCAVRGPRRKRPVLAFHAMIHQERRLDPGNRESCVSSRRTGLKGCMRRDPGCVGRRPRDPGCRLRPPWALIFNALGVWAIRPQRGRIAKPRVAEGAPWVSEDARQHPLLVHPFIAKAWRSGGRPGRASGPA